MLPRRKQDRKKYLLDLVMLVRASLTIIEREYAKSQQCVFEICEEEG